MPREPHPGAAPRPPSRAPAIYRLSGGDETASIPPEQEFATSVRYERQPLRPTCFHRPAADICQRRHRHYNTAAKRRLREASRYAAWCPLRAKSRGDNRPSTPSRHLYRARLPALPVFKKVYGIARRSQEGPEAGWRRLVAGSRIAQAEPERAAARIRCYNALRASRRPSYAAP